MPFSWSDSTRHLGFLLSLSFSPFALSFSLLLEERRGTSTVNPSTSSVLWRVVYGLELYKDLVKVGSRQKALEEYTQCERAMRKIRRIEESVGGELEKKKKERRKESRKLWKIPIAIEEKYCSNNYFNYRNESLLQNIAHVVAKNNFWHKIHHWNLSTET